VLRACARSARAPWSALAVAAALGAADRLEGQTVGRGSMVVSAQVVDVPAIRGMAAPREIRRDGRGATFAAPLTVSGAERLHISVSVPASALGAPADLPPLSVRGTGGTFRPLVPGGAAVVIADRLAPAAVAELAVEYRVERRPATAQNAGTEPLLLTYTIWFPGGP